MINPFTVELTICLWKNTKQVVEQYSHVPNNYKDTKP